MSNFLDEFFDGVEQPNEQEFLWAAEEIRKSITNKHAKTLLDIYVTHYNPDDPSDIDIAILGAIAYFLQFAPKPTKYSFLETVLEVDVILHSIQLYDDEGDE